ncbi:hypothetical protein [Nocardia brevicatena]|nr:hypothetical protein [Nocardia brevicatena]
MDERGRPKRSAVVTDEGYEVLAGWRRETAQELSNDPADGFGERL